MKNRRQIVNILLLIILIYLCWVLGRGLWDLYGAQDRIAVAEAELVEAKVKNEELLEKMDEVDTDEFREEEVRDKLGRQLPGETVIIVPSSEYRVPSDVGKGSQELANWEKWWELFFFDS